MISIEEKFKPTDGATSQTSGHILSRTLGTRNYSTSVPPLARTILLIFIGGDDFFTSWLIRRHHAFGLRQCAFHGSHIHGKPEFADGEQFQGQRHGFVIREHDRR